MTTLLTHPAIPISLAVAARGFLSRRLVLGGIFLSILPDIDVIAMRLGVLYQSAYGHRGFTHSLVFAVLVALITAALFRLIGVTLRQSLPFLLLCSLSHSVLDALTNGGYGVAWLWPLSNERYFFPWRPIEVSPMSIGAFFSERGLVVFKSEIIWVWFPCLLLGAFAVIFRKR